MRRIFLMSSVLLAAPFVFGEMGEASAQCVATTDCASLGYTETSCPNGGIRCPFGSTWSCKPENCDASFKYACSGTGYAGGSGNACGGKYVSCNCAAGYDWDTSAKICTKHVETCTTVYGTQEYDYHGCSGCSTNGEGTDYHMSIGETEQCRVGVRVFNVVHISSQKGSYSTKEACEKACANEAEYTQNMGECSAEDC